MLACVDALPQGTLVFFWMVVKLLAVNANVSESLTQPSCVRNHSNQRSRPGNWSRYTSSAQITKLLEKELTLLVVNSQHSSAHRVVRREEST